MSSLADFFTVPPDGSCSCVVRDREQTAGGITTEGPTRRRPMGHRQGAPLSAGREAYCPPTRRLARPWSDVMLREVGSKLELASLVGVLVPVRNSSEVAGWS